jgi:hypothetical protein
MRLWYNKNCLGDTKLSIRFFLLITLLTTSINVFSAERFLLSFELLEGEKTLEKGKAIISQNKRTWQKGLQRSFLKLDCQQTKTGEMKKLYSTVDFFTGLRVTHQLVESNIEINVARTIGKPRVTEIRALPAEECIELAPFIDTTVQSYTFPAKPFDYEYRSFDENLTFRIRIQSIGGTR